LRSERGGLVIGSRSIGNRNIGEQVVVATLSVYSLLLSVPPKYVFVEVERVRWLDSHLD